MLSMLIDRLRSHADLYDGTKEPSLEPKLQRPWLARELREAADTIWQLRDDLQRANAENARLRSCLSDDAENARLIMGENARLRELANAVKEFVEDTHCEDCPCRRDCDDNNRIFCVNDFSYHAFAAMRELGVEV